MIRQRPITNKPTLCLLLQQLCVLLQMFGGCRPVAFYVKPAEPLRYGHIYCEQTIHHFVYAARFQQSTSNRVIPLRDECFQDMAHGPNATNTCKRETNTLESKGEELSRPMFPTRVETGAMDELPKQSKRLLDEQIHWRCGQSCFFAIYFSRRLLLRLGLDAAHATCIPNYQSTPKSRFTTAMAYAAGKTLFPRPARAMQQPPPLSNHPPRQTTLRVASAGKGYGLTCEAVECSSHPQQKQAFA